MHTCQSSRGMVSAPHHLASQAGRDVLKDGGTAIEATIAMAATLSVLYPHMTGLGGDGFWLIMAPDGKTQAIDACGSLASAASLDFYRKKGLSTIPWRGGLAANTVAGTVSGWQKALDYSAGYQSPLPLARLLEDAIHYATEGRVVSRGEHDILTQKGDELKDPSFRQVFYPYGAGKPLAYGEKQRFPALAQTLRHLAEHGPASFYEGPLAAAILEDLQKSGSPLSAEDLSHYAAQYTAPLHTDITAGRLYNTAPPTQGTASLLILALFDRLKDGISVESADYVHLLVEATKQAFIYRNRHIDGRKGAEEQARILLTCPDALADMAARIQPRHALPWTMETQWGDTTWMGAIDHNGMAVSMIQSLYFEYGSGVFLPQTGLIWQNRGSSFRLAREGWNPLIPGRKPFHTLNPAAAELHDGRRIVYGTMGGEGQPQTQAAIFTRHVHYGIPLQESISRPRWLLGRTWGEDSLALKMEPGFPPEVEHSLRQYGHDVETLAEQSTIMGHAGMLSRHESGLLEGGYDPRSDGSVAAW